MPMCFKKHDSLPFPVRGSRRVDTDGFRMDELAVTEAYLNKLIMNVLRNERTDRRTDGINFTLINLMQKFMTFD